MIMLNKISIISIISITSLVINSCSTTPLDINKLKMMRSYIIINNMKDYPQVMTYYTSLSTPLIGKFKSPLFKAQFNKTINNYLANKGFQYTQNPNQADLVITIDGLSIPIITNSFGYGLFQGQILDILEKPISFIYANIKFTLPNKVSYERTLRKVSYLPIKNLPVDPYSLKQDQQDNIIKIITNDIDANLLKILQTVNIYQSKKTNLTPKAPTSP